jgi:hypothetical protein
MYFLVSRNPPPLQTAKLFVVKLKAAHDKLCRALMRKLRRD